MHDLKKNFSFEDIGIDGGLLSQNYRNVCYQSKLKVIGQIIAIRKTGSHPRALRITDCRSININIF